MTPYVQANPGWYALFAYYTREGTTHVRWPVLAWGVDPGYPALVLARFSDGCPPQPVTVDMITTGTEVLIGFFHPEQFPEPEDLSEWEGVLLGCD
jgi:hypothetical protein